MENAVPVGQWVVEFVYAQHVAAHKAATRVGQQGLHGLGSTEPEIVDQHHFARAGRQQLLANV